MADVDEDQDQDRVPIRVLRLADPTPDEMAKFGVRYCDGCGQEQLFGCVAAVRIGWGYSEVCRECLDKLKAALAALEGA